MVWAYGFRAFFLILPLATVGAVIPLQVLWLDGASVGVWHGHEQVFGFLAAALSSLRVGAAALGILPDPGDADHRHRPRTRTTVVTRNIRYFEPTGVALIDPFE